MRNRLLGDLERVGTWSPSLLEGVPEESLTAEEGSMRWAWRIAWTIAYAANLFLPLYWGPPMCAPAGQLGLALAVLGYWAAGCRACDGRTRSGRALIYGGVVLAASQLRPLAQVAAGSIALGIWGASPPNARPLTGTGGFAVTAMTGGILLVAALAVGLLIDLMIHRTPTRKPKPAAWDEL